MYVFLQVENPPTSKWTKNEIQQWLMKHNVNFPANSFKKELLQMALQVNVPTRHVIDEMAHEQGHVILRLPPYHCHYNPIELVWSEAKRAFASEGRTIEIFNI